MAEICFLSAIIQSLGNPLGSLGNAGKWQNNNEHGGKNDYLVNTSYNIIIIIINGTLQEYLQ